MPDRKRTPKPRVPKIVPKGADEPLPPLPDPAFSDAEKAAVSDVWDESVSDEKYKGMLDAEVVE